MTVFFSRFSSPLLHALPKQARAFSEVPKHVLDRLTEGTLQERAVALQENRRLLAHKGGEEEVQQRVTQLMHDIALSSSVLPPSTENHSAAKNAAPTLAAWTLLKPLTAIRPIDGSFGQFASQDLPANTPVAFLAAQRHAFMLDGEPPKGEFYALTPASWRRYTTHLQLDPLEEQNLSCTYLEFANPKIPPNMGSAFFRDKCITPEMRQQLHSLRDTDISKAHIEGVVLEFMMNYLLHLTSNLSATRPLCFDGTIDGIVTFKTKTPVNEGEELSIIDGPMAAVANELLPSLLQQGNVTQLASICSALINTASTMRAYPIYQASTPAMVTLEETHREAEKLFNIYNQGKYSLSQLLALPVEDFLEKIDDTTALLILSSVAGLNGLSTLLRIPADDNDFLNFLTPYLDDMSKGRYGQRLLTESTKWTSLYSELRDGQYTTNLEELYDRHTKLYYWLLINLLDSRLETSSVIDGYLHHGVLSYQSGDIDVPREAARQIYNASLAPYPQM